MISQLTLPEQNFETSAREQPCAIFHAQGPRFATHKKLKQSTSITNKSSKLLFAVRAQCQDKLYGWLTSQLLPYQSTNDHYFREQ